MRGGLFSESGLREAVWRLAALAVLAEITASRCLPVRWYVLGLLRNTERIVRKALIEQTGWDPSDVERLLAHVGDPDGLSDSGSDPVDAVALAWRLRALAVLLATLLPPAWAAGAGMVPPVAAPRRLASQAVLLLSVPRDSGPAAPDTS